MPTVKTTKAQALPARTAKASTAAKPPIVPAKPAPAKKPSTPARVAPPPKASTAAVIVKAAAPAPVPAKASAGVDLAHLTAEAGELLQLADKAVAAANAAGGEESVRKAGIGAAATFAKAAQDFATTQAAEVIAGRLPLSKWRENLALWRRQGESVVKDAEERTSLLYRVAHAVAGGVEAGVNAVTDKVKALRAKFNEITSARASVAKLKASLQGRKVSAQVSAELFGEPFSRAEATFSQLASMVQALERGAAAITGKSSPGLSGLGAVPVIGAGAAVATVAIAGALASSLWSYYQHAGEVARNEIARLELELIKEGKGEEALAFRKARNEADKTRQESDPSPFASLAAVAKWVGGGLIVAGLGWAAREVIRSMPKAAVTT